MKNIDLSNVGSREPLEAGEYSFTIVKAEEKVTKNTNKDMISVQLKELETGKLVFDNFVIQENTLWKLKEFLDAIGMDTSGPFELDVNDLVGLTVLAEVIQEEYNDDMHNRVKKYLA